LLENFINKKVEVCFASNSGTGVDNGSQSARTLSSSYGSAIGLLAEYDIDFVKLENAYISMVPQYAQNIGFGTPDKKEIKTNELLIRKDKIIFISII